ncbi:hypothetical protein IGI04_033113 [Brassica rapa subsp. trilocularis]|uniref:F-box associated beta-propeller type 3 domain-containing protein n=1 Tax=Brassica rapa subsp. trilocularis TaxID=1813537 RepID=A0ABQ7L8B7_BRACM|nr:hypothetical protein IGI04_033113 [Brassica rapa subsp. trilocularis]
MSFDVRSEIFHMVELPSRIRHDVLISYEGKLACIDGKNGTRLWILEDADKHKWSFQDFLLPLSEWNLNVSRKEHYWYEDYRCNCFKLKGCNHAGEFIYVTSMFHKSSYIVFYNPVTNSCRRLKFNGIVDGLLNMHAFPNHIESFMSL